jgi:hypothetical protein
MTVNIYRSRISEAARDEGRWCTFVDGSKWKLASMSSPAFAKTLSEKRKPHAGLLAAAPESEEAAKIRHDTMIEAVAEVIVKDWNVGDEDGPMACTAENVLRILRDPGFDPHSAFVLRESADTMSYSVARLDAGNSDAGSAGT